jgi:hypothetical protein
MAPDDGLAKVSHSEAVISGQHECPLLSRAYTRVLIIVLPLPLPFGDRLPEAPTIRAVETNIQSNRTRQEIKTISLISFETGRSIHSREKGKGPVSQMQSFQLTCEHAS